MLRLVLAEVIRLSASGEDTVSQGQARRWYLAM